MFDINSLLYRADFLFLFLIACIFVLNLVLVRMLKIGERRTKQLEYVWLAIAALSIFAAAQEGRALVVSIQRENADQRLETSGRSLIGWARSFEEHTCTEAQVPDAQFPLRARDFGRLCDWLREQDRTVQTKIQQREVIPIRSIIETYPEITDFLVSTNWAAFVRNSLVDHWDSWNNHLSIANDQEDRYDSISHSAFRMMFVPIIPILLVLAIAVRVVKTNSEIRLIKARESQE